MEAFYSSDEDVCWGPYSLREAKRDLKSNPKKISRRHSHGGQLLKIDTNREQPKKIMNESSDVSSYKSALDNSTTNFVNKFENYENISYIDNIHLTLVQNTVINSSDDENTEPSAYKSALEEATTTLKDSRISDSASSFLKQKQNNENKTNTGVLSSYVVNDSTSCTGRPDVARYKVIPKLTLNNVTYNNLEDDVEELLDNYHNEDIKEKTFNSFDSNSDFITDGKYRDISSLDGVNDSTSSIEQPGVRSYGSKNYESELLENVKEKTFNSFKNNDNFIKQVQPEVVSYKNHLSVSSEDYESDVEELHDNCHIEGTKEKNINSFESNDNFMQQIQPKVESYGCIPKLSVNNVSYNNHLSVSSEDYDSDVQELHDNCYKEDAKEKKYSLFESNDNFINQLQPKVGSYGCIPKLSINNVSYNNHLSISLEDSDSDVQELHDNCHNEDVKEKTFSSLESNGNDKLNIDNIITKLSTSETKDSSYVFDDTLEEMENALKYGLDYKMASEINEEIQYKDKFEISSHEQSLIISGSCMANTTKHIQPEQKIQKNLFYIPPKSKIPSPKSKIPLLNPTKNKLSPTGDTKFKVPITPCKQKITPKKTTPIKSTGTQNLYKHVISPVGYYIKNGPTPNLKQNIIIKNKDTNIDISPVTSPNTRTVDTDSSFSLPPVVYKPSKIQKVYTEKDIVIPPSIQKLTFPPTKFRKHERRICENPLNESEINRMLSEGDLTSAEIDNNDISVITEKQCFAR